MKKRLSLRILSLCLLLSMLLSCVAPISAAQTDSAATEQQLSFHQVDNDTVSALPANEAEELEDPQEYADTDPVRVSIVLEGKSTVEAGFPTRGMAQNAKAVAYRQALAREQAVVTTRIQTAIGAELDVQWNLTLAANIISATVQYGQIEAIEAVEGVREVVIENRYEPAVVNTEETVDPNMATSGDQIGSLVAWANGYTGAGSRIAVIDTGTDTDHQSFDLSGWQYSLAYAAGQAGMTPEDYMDSLDLLDAEEIASVLNQLNIENGDAEKLYINEKLPFGYNYVDGDYDITHDNDDQGEHGSHVAGIATANAYIPTENGNFEKALTSVRVQGVAPDAQLITMKVFGKDGGAYESDYMAAIEDAIILGCDVVNLSLGSVYPGFGYNDTYAELLEGLEKTDTLVVTSGSNSGAWAANDYNLGYNYADEVSLSTAGHPGTYFNTLSVASVDNEGLTDYYFSVGDNLIFYNEYDPASFGMDSIVEIAGQQEYIFIDGIGTEEDWEAVGDAIRGKVAFCSRGTTSFYEKASEAVWAGAIATVIYNNQPGTINMDMSDYDESEPCVLITQADGDLVRQNSTPVTDEEGNILYYTGTMMISSEVGVVRYDNAYQTMSSFSSWGVPGSLILKPEITAPGGNIYSLNGSDPSGTAYENMSGTSMASPQVAGMAALVAQYIRENGFETEVTVRALTQSLLMSTATPIFSEESGGNYYSVMQQGSGVANVGAAVTAGSYILMGEDSTSSYADGKVKAELLDDPDRTGEYSFSFTLNDLTGNDASYTLSSDFFTQDVFEYEGELYLDTNTVSLPVELSYTVDGETFVPRAAVACDLDGDGDTDADDAQMILDYVAGLTDSIAEEADRDGDGEITSYDAHVLLANMTTATFTVPQGGKVEITVHVKLTDSTKEYLDTYYAAGAYVEGFVYVKPCVTEEGAYGDVEHSIPVLGFYGNWSDSPMYESITYTGYLYDDWRMPHNGQAATNNIVVKYKGQTGSYFLVGNPYVIEETFPAERVAINSSDSIYQYRFSLIRNASALAMVVMDESGEILYISPVQNDINSEFYYVNAGAWYYTVMSLQTSLKLKSLGVEEGQTLQISLVAVPEYYRQDEPIDEAYLRELITSGELGEGVWLNTTLRVDNTAPEATLIAKDLQTGNLLVSTQDNQYVSAILVYNKRGELLAGTMPYQTEANQLTTVAVDLSGVTVGETCTVVVADYANNTSTYEVEYGGEPESFAGMFYGFTAGDGRDLAKRWVLLDPETLYYANTANMDGMKTQQFTDLDVLAAEYLDGNVFMIADDGVLYVAEHGDWDNYTKVGKTGLRNVYDMAYNYADGQMYVLAGYNVIYTLDLLTGAATKAHSVSIENPRDEDEDQLITLAIDDEGNFYSINGGGMSRYNFLFTWSLDDVNTKGRVSGLEPINNTKNGNIGYDAGYEEQQSMAWDHDNDKLYWAASYETNNGFSNYLCVFDLETGKASQVNAGGWYMGSHLYDALTFDPIYGLYIVPSFTSDEGESAPATGVELTESSKTIYKGAEFTLKAFVMPWTVEDRSVTWTTSDASIATVDANGVVKGTGAGVATITATANTDPSLYAECTVTVELLETTDLKAMVRGTDGSFSWVEFTSNEPAAWTAVGESDNYYGGALYNGKLLTHNGKEIFEVDPESFEAVSLGDIASSWIWSDAAMVPENEDIIEGTQLAALCYNGLFMELLDPYAGTLTYFDFSKTQEGDPFAAIAYAGDAMYEKKWEAHKFYLLSESGKLYEALLWNFNGWLQLNRTLVGGTGLDLTDASLITGGSYASMLMDETTGHLIVSTYTGDGETMLYAVDPSTAETIELGSFGGQTAGVTTLYQFDRIMELTVLLNTYETSSYVEETVQLVASVKPWYLENGVTWTSSDETIATVDENGLVSCLKEGTVTITATSIDLDENGDPATASCTIEVLPVVKIDIDLKAQVETADGQYQWIQFNAAQIADATVDATTELKVTAGTGHNGKIYADTAEGIVVIDPADSYKASEPVASTETFLDMTTAPTLNHPWAYVPGIGSCAALTFNFPVFIGTNNSIGFLTDASTGEVFTWGYLNRTYTKLGAIAYTGKTKLNGAAAQGFTMLDTDGKLYSFTATPITWNADGKATNYAIAHKAIGNIGMTFSDKTKLSMVYVNTDTLNGYLICDTSSGVANLYYVDMSTGTPKTDKAGMLADVVDMTAMYSVSDMNIVGDDESTVNSIGDDDVFAVWSGTDTQASTLLFMDDEYAAPQEGEFSSLNAMANPVTGSTNTTADNTVRQRTIAVETTGVEVTDNTVKLTVVEDAAVTNGLYQISYDPAVLTYASIASLAEISAVRVDESNGLITFTMAATQAMAANSTVVEVNFTYTAQYIDTQLSITALERNEAVSLEEEALVIPVLNEVGGHSYEVTERVEATCLEDGYVIYTCTKCGHSFTEILEKNGDNCPSKAFADLDVNAWYHEAVDFVLLNGLMNGVDAEKGLFDPNGILTRAQLVTVLYRMAGAPSVEELQHPFTDVAEDTWYTDAVLWAYNEGIVKGMDETTFAPNASITREQIATIFYRYAEGAPVEEDVLADFADAADVSDWAAEAMNWAVSTGLIQGMEDGTLVPKGNATRVQIAAILMRYCRD